MLVSIIYVLVALGVAIGVKLNEEEFTREWVNKDEEDFVTKQLVFSFIWPLILLLFVFCALYFIVLGINKFIDKNKKKK
jgi:uncharacterized membrane protein